MKMTDSPKSAKFSDLDQDPTIGYEIKKFCKETSFTAVTRIHGAKSIFKRFIWIIVFLSMLAWVTFQITWLLTDYLKYPIDVQIQLESTHELEFPSVTICNLNPIIERKMNNSPFESIQHLQRSDELYKLATQGEGGQDAKRRRAVQTRRTAPPSPPVASPPPDFNIWDTLSNDTDGSSFYDERDVLFDAALQYGVISVGMTGKEVKSYGHSLTKSMISCQWKGYSCSPNNFTYFHNYKYGNCYTFNDAGPGGPLETLTTTMSGPLFGLVLELNIEQEKYSKSLSPQAGFRVVVHRRGTMPFPEDDGILLAPGAVTSVGIKMTKVTRLPLPHGNCTADQKQPTSYNREYGVMFSKDACLKSCYQNVSRQVCNCEMCYYQIEDRNIVCNVTETDNCLRIIRKEKKEELIRCDEQCPPPCKDVYFTLSPSTAMWPSKAYSGVLTSKSEQVNSDMRDQPPKQEEAFAKLEVYFKDLSFEHIEQQEGYASENLISDMGGQLGLWLGLSAITVGELLEFIFVIARRIGSLCFSRKITTNVQPINMGVQ